MKKWRVKLANNIPSDASDKLSDEELAKRLKDGNDDAGRLLFERFRAYVYRIARSFVDTETSLDIVQEVFVRVLTGIRDFRSGAKFSTWLHRVTMNCCYDILRRKKVRSKEALGETFFLARSDGSEPPDVAAERTELERAFRTATNALSPKLRSVFTLRFSEQLSYSEIAETLGISIGTVMSRLFYARRQLLDALKEYI